MEESWVEVGLSSIANSTHQNSKIPDQDVQQKQQWFEELKESLHEAVEDPNCPENIKQSWAKASSLDLDWSLPDELGDLHQMKSLLEETAQVLGCDELENVPTNAAAVLVKIKQLDERCASLEAALKERNENVKTGDKMVQSIQSNQDLQKEIETLQQENKKLIDENASKGANMLQYRQIVEALRDILSAGIPGDGGTVPIEQLPAVLSEVLKKAAEDQAMVGQQKLSTEPEIERLKKREAEGRSEAERLKIDIEQLQLEKTSLEQHLEYQKNKSNAELKVLETKLESNEENRSSLEQELEKTKKQYNIVANRLQEFKNTSEELLEEHRKLLSEKEALFSEMKALKMKATDRSPRAQVESKVECHICNTKDTEIRQLRKQIEINKQAICQGCAEKDMQMQRLNHQIRALAQAECEVCRSKDQEIEHICQVLGKVNQTEGRGCQKCDAIKDAVSEKLNEIEGAQGGRPSYCSQMLNCFLKELLTVEQHVVMLKGTEDSNIDQSSILQIVEMGYSTKQAQLALQNCGGSIDEALEMILSGNLPTIEDPSAPAMNVNDTLVNTLRNVKEHFHILHNQGSMNEVQHEIAQRDVAAITRQEREQLVGNISCSRIEIGHIMIFLPEPGSADFYALTTDEHARYKLSQDSKDMIGQNGIDPTFFNRNIIVGSVFLITNLQGQDVSSSILHPEHDMMTSDSALDEDLTVYSVSVLPVGNFHL